MAWISNEPIWELTDPPINISFKYPITNHQWWTSIAHQIYKIQITGIWMGRSWIHEEIITHEAVENPELIQNHINAQIQARIQNYVR